MKPILCKCGETLVYYKYDKRPKTGMIIKSKDFQFPDKTSPEPGSSAIVKCPHCGYQVNLIDRINNSFFNYK